MADHRALSGALPWYAVGTLEAAERARVEAHLETCDDCRAQLRQIRRFAELGAEVPVERALKHVAPGLLVAYADDRDALDAETRAFVESRLADCPTCREAYANLEQSAATLLAADETRDRRRARSSARSPSLPAQGRLWGWLSATLLQPAPALAYLLIAAVGLPLLWTLRTPGDAVAAVQVVGVSGERGLRDDDGQGEQTLDIALDDARAPVLVELLTDLNAEDLGRGMAFTVELSAGDRIVWSRPSGSAAFVLRDGRGVLPLVLDPSALGLDRDYRLAIRVERPGDPLDGQALFVRRLRFQGK